MRTLLSAPAFAGRSARVTSFSDAHGEFVEGSQPCPARRLGDKIANQFDGPAFRVHDAEAARVRDEIENRAMLDGPLDPEPHSLEKPLQLPSARAKRADVADRAHRNFHQAARVAERLRLSLRT